MRIRVTIDDGLVEKAKRLSGISDPAALGGTDPSAKAGRRRKSR